MHPLLYSKTKGELESSLKKLDFPCLHIYRPGLLDRKEIGERRFAEKLALKIFPALAVDKLAAFMIKQSVVYLDTEKTDKVKVFADKDIYPR